MLTLWIIISIVLAINSMWLLKLNKDLTQTNDELIATIKACTVKDNEEDMDEDN